MPVSGLWLTPDQPNSEVVVLPRMMAPASSSRGITGASTVGTWPFSEWVPRSVGIPAVSVRSLIVTGKPNSEPVASPRVSAASARCAASRARSAVSVAKALMRGSQASMRASTASISSTGESSLRRISGASSVAGVKQRSSVTGDSSAVVDWGADHGGRGRSCHPGVAGIAGCARPPV